MTQRRKLRIENPVWELLESEEKTINAEIAKRGVVSAETEHRCGVLYEAVYQLLPSMDGCHWGQQVEPIANAAPPFTQYLMRYHGLSVVYLACPDYVIALTAGWTTNARTVCSWVDENDIQRAVASVSK